MYSHQYYDVRNVAGYSRAKNLLLMNAKNDSKENKEEKRKISEFLSNKNIYTLHAPVRYKF